uniref:DUF4817 domain-containing protein n=1 Tax=Amphimedon queenslandica TaxID=400682 RepID=A0A1X7V717_AMPQE
MLLYQYFEKKDGHLPDPSSSSSSNLPSAAIVLANAEVRRCVTKARPCGRCYNSYTPEERATIARYAFRNGVMATKRNFFAKLNLKINESTVRRFKKAYIEERGSKRAVCEDDDAEITKLPPKKRGRKVLLGENMDSMGRSYAHVTRMREKGGVVNTSIVKAAARGILMSQERLRLAEFGGPATLTTAWAKLLLKRMNYTQRRGTTKAKVSVPKFNQAKELFYRK